MTGLTPLMEAVRWGTPPRLAGHYQRVIPIGDTAFVVAADDKAYYIVKGKRREIFDASCEEGLVFPVGQRTAFFGLHRIQGCISDLSQIEPGRILVEIQRKSHRGPVEYQVATF